MTRIVYGEVRENKIYMEALQGSNMKVRGSPGADQGGQGVQGQVRDVKRSPGTGEGGQGR